ncbi:MAG: preprotein translocase subunit SecA [Anaerolineales bacterium]|nr:preprotein translocase subunit SecA [Anaerolineales bacterium]MCB9171329.1 preprotein translocase subunit SecA [Ardenticatenales bacterium]
MFKKLYRAVMGDPNEKAINRLQPLVDKINDLEKTFEAKRDDALLGMTADFRQRLANGATLDDLLPEAFAAVREAARRTIGLRHYDVQLIGGIVLHQGKIAEMKTGEGKTLVATLPLYLNALEGRGAHLVTPNDYLSKVGCQLMGPVYNALGMSVGVIQSNTGDGVHQPAFIFDSNYDSDDDRYQHLRLAPRQEVYAADITYGTNNEFGFDYLRDNMVRARRQLVQRELRYAIVDEVDNILIDEARTPLIISGPAEEPSPLYAKMAELVKRHFTDRGIEQSDFDELKKAADAGDAEAQAELDDYMYVVDFKNRAAAPLEKGVDAIERALGIDNLYDPANFEATHFLDNAVRAQALYELDKDYVVTEENEIVIVDEFTGRMMWGRRFSEGLHQAIEAKEGVEVKRENVTLATITFQNFFRMYDKLAGMTGTAVTEAEEFGKIYDLDVVAIPTNKPVVRDDRQDFIYKNERSKYRAVIQDIKEMHEAGRPVLVGTASIERSELLSRLLTREKIPHEVLNAKQHEREAEIIAQAGRPGRVTIATNMAGRGVDILLGGNPEGMARRELRQQGLHIADVPEDQFQAALSSASQTAKADREKVKSLGGLHIIGTERHDARRIDNQLRGRAGRQGDPGSSRFYISLEDDLMKRFGGVRMAGLMERIGFEEDIPIENRMISGAIENAQEKVEGHNFDIRKRVLEYDDVVNTQRDVIYKQRREVLESLNLRPEIEDMLESAIERSLRGLLDLDDYGNHPDYHLALSNVRTVLPIDEAYDVGRWQTMSEAEIVEDLTAEMRRLYDQREVEFGQLPDERPLMREVERQLMLDIVDNHWIRHLTELNDLRQGIGLRAVAQQDPVVAYKQEASMLWGGLIDSITEEVTSKLFAVRPVMAAQRDEEREMQTNRSDSGDEAPVNQPVRRKARPGRNDPCHCGSGKKYKHCHMQEDRRKSRGRAAD